MPRKDELTSKEVVQQSFIAFGFGVVFALYGYGIRHHLAPMVADSPEAKENLDLVTYSLPLPFFIIAALLVRRSCKLRRQEEEQRLADIIAAADDPFVIGQPVFPPKGREAGLGNPDYWRSNSPPDTAPTDDAASDLPPSPPPDDQ
jgi:hypothetical protein